MIQYDLEQQIMRCWAVCDDIQDLRKFRSERELTEDELDNYLLGLVSLYHIKFEYLFSMFEQMLKAQVDKTNAEMVGQTAYTNLP